MASFEKLENALKSLIDKDTILALLIDRYGTLIISAGRTDLPKESLAKLASLIGGSSIRFAEVAGFERPKKILVDYERFTLLLVFTGKKYDLVVVSSGRVELVTKRLEEISRLVP
jgi:predicted regulator of Ras-like GTPase activity (Roadblock/LC7/MglB family)